MNALTTLRHELSQFFTPQHVADLMASMFVITGNEIELLDPGAGEGALTAAFVKQICKRDVRPGRIRVTAFEIDPKLIGRLKSTLRRCRQMCSQVEIDFEYKIYRDDFIAVAVGSLRREFFSTVLPSFNVGIINPPYRKLRSDSRIRSYLASIGIETSNFYSAFVALTLRLLSDGGELVAITPRSFCNGPYFRPFRLELLRISSLRRIHLFHSRSAAFSRDKVLQENVIMHVVKGEPNQLKVALSNSTGAAESEIELREVPYKNVVSPMDPERFIHINIDKNEFTLPLIKMLKYELVDLDLNVSTGRVVDFRSKIHLRKHPGRETAPLIYPIHFNGGFVEWPRASSRKPNAILINDDTRNLLVASGFYVLVRRFSSKEERRRVVACTFDPKLVPTEFVGFENHLNYFHCAGSGLNATLARGLMAFLNSTLVDAYFRQFSGHTQVNATDLRKLRYPSKRVLEALGESCGYSMSQEEIDTLLSEELLNEREETQPLRKNAGPKAERVSTDPDNTRLRSKAVE